MANLYKNFASETLMSFGKSFARLNGQPLDKSAIWYTKDEADAYAATGSAYVGQPVAVIDETAKTTTLYVVGQNNTLEMVGSLPDGVSLELHEGKVQLKGFDEAAAGAQLRKNADGEIEWFTPSTDTVDGLQSSVSGLQSDMKTAQEDIAALEGLVGETAVATQIDDKITALNLGETYEAKGAAATAKSEIEAVIGEVAENKTVVEMIADAQAAATYDDTALAGRVKAIEDDHLVAADKTELEGKIATAKTEAISEAVAQVLGEGVDEKYDTLVEVANWIISDSTSSAELVAKVNTIEGDYLKGADKTELQGEIDDLEAYVGALPEGAASDNVVAYIQEVVDALKIGDYAKAADLTTLAGRVTTIETKLAGIEEEAQKNKVETVSAEFDLTDRHLTIKEIAQEKITGLPDALLGKVDKQDGYRMISDAEAQKIEKLVLGEDGSVSVSGTIAAGNVDGLADWITARADTLEGLSKNNFNDTLLAKLNGIEEGAQANKIEGVSNEFTISADGKILNVNLIEMSKINGLPEALAGKVNAEEGKGLSTNDLTDELVEKINTSQANVIEGVKVNGTLLDVAEKIVEIKTSDIVKASAEVTVAEDGTLGIGEIGVSKLVGDATLILNGGNAEG